jgi:hypothetical protein
MLFIYSTNGFIQLKLKKAFFYRICFDNSVIYGTLLSIIVVVKDQEGFTHYSTYCIRRFTITKQAKLTIDSCI